MLTIFAYGIGMYPRIACAIAALALFAGPALADEFVSQEGDTGVSGSTTEGYLQCVPYARRVTGIHIFGDAHTWWGQAEGRYARGTRPRVGAVMAFHPHGNSTLGHVAAVSKIVDSRTVLVSHANWSPINGRRGQIERNVPVVDVSPDNDWSEVRVWYAPIEDLGTTHWPLDGFIYNKNPGREQKLIHPAVFRRPPAAPDRRDYSDDPIGRIIAQRIR